MLLFTVSCSVVRKTQKEDIKPMEQEDLVVIKRTLEQNISRTGFFIERGRISTSGEGGRISLMFSLKYNEKGEYLISLRSNTGMEAFRVMLTKDTVLINDRINQTVLYGNPYDFERITGIPADLLIVIFGDLFRISGKANIYGEDSRAELRIEDYFLGLLVKTVIDKRIAKVKSVLITTGVTDEYISIDYLKHREDRFKLPKKVEINDFRRKVKIALRIEKYSVPWIGEIEFIPGKGFKQKRIL